MLRNHHLARPSAPLPLPQDYKFSLCSGYAAILSVALFLPHQDTSKDTCGLLHMLLPSCVSFRLSYRVAEKVKHGLFPFVVIAVITLHDAPFYHRCINRPRRHRKSASIRFAVPVHFEVRHGLHVRSFTNKPGTDQGRKGVKKWRKDVVFQIVLRNVIIS